MASAAHDCGPRNTRRVPNARRLHHLTLTVTDLEASVAWYGRVLGLDRFADRSGPGWERILVGSPGELLIGLTRHDATAPGEAFDPARVGLDHLSVACEDRFEVEVWADHLSALGVAHEDIVDAPAGHVLVCQDPDGIPVEFFASR